MLAAANPQAEFWANDFMPSHIADAQALADAVEVGNLNLCLDSFEEYLARDLPKFDFIVLHGILSWVNARNRDLLRQFLRKNLAQGGLVYASYNAMPGWASVTPLRELMQAFLVGDPTPSPDRIMQAARYAAQFARLGAPGLPDTPILRQVATALPNRSPNYVAHEFLNANLTPFYAHQIIADMAKADLDFVGRANRTDMIARLAMPDSFRTMAGQSTTPAYRETLFDFAAGTTLRQDLFARGAARVSQTDRTEMLARQIFALTNSKAHAVAVFKNHSRATQLPIAEIEEICSQLENEARALGRLSERQSDALGLLTTEGLVQVVPGAEVNNRCSHLNAILADRAIDAGQGEVLISPITRNGVRLVWVELVFIKAIADGSDPVTSAVEASARLKNSDEPALSDDDGAITARFEEFQRFLFPVLKRLQLLRSSGGG